jgi:2,4-dienoyl-CoA reductase-like NADH-dependent reductase (Old Yellow Enzyme family)
MGTLFSSFTLCQVSFRNRIGVSPMCQYSSDNGHPTDWHLAHLGSRAVGGAGLVIAEATAVSPAGRISPGDSGIWAETQREAFRRIAAFIKAQGAVAGIQIGHAGRKGSTNLAWLGGKPLRAHEGGWETIAPSALPFDSGFPPPREMGIDDMEDVIMRFKTAAVRCAQAGFEVLEIHMAHGYLLHQFLSPITNQRTDEFGGTLENRMRLPLRVAQSVREVWPADRPLFVRISATDWVENGWDLAQSIILCSRLKTIGVNLIDTSSGGLVPYAKIPMTPGYQVPFAEAIRKEVGIATAAVGLITQPAQAEEIVSSGQADMVLLAREMLRDPYWPLHAARALGAVIEWPRQYLRAK